MPRNPAPESESDIRFAAAQGNLDELPASNGLRDEQFDEITLFVGYLSLNRPLIEESVQQLRCRYPEHDTQDGGTVESVRKETIREEPGTVMAEKVCDGVRHSQKHQTPESRLKGRVVPDRLSASVCVGIR